MDISSLFNSLCFGLFCCYVFVSGNSVDQTSSILVTGNEVFADLLERVKELEARDSQLVNRVAMLEDEGHEQRKIIDEMKQEMTAYKKRNSEMIKELSKTKQTIMNLKTKTTPINE